MPGRALQGGPAGGDSAAAARGGPALSSRSHPSAWIAIWAGLTWLLGAAGDGLGATLVAVPPGALLLAGGVSSLLLPGDLRTPQISGAGGLLGVLLALPWLLFADFGFGLWLGLLSAAGLVSAGWLALAQEPPGEDVPAPPLGPAYAAQAGLDEAMLGAMSWVQPRPGQQDLVEMAREVTRAAELFYALGWDDEPASFHQLPPPLFSPDLEHARSGGIEHEVLRFESGYEPKADIPGRDRWQGYRANRTVHAWLRRHPGEPRPWLLCLHGFGMGSPLPDLQGMRSNWLHRELGLNVAHVVLPVHGPRAPGRLSGAAFMTPSLLNLVHAEAQAMWDLRRLLTWVRQAQGAPAVGVYGLSLGGYTAALLAGLDPDLHCVIAGIPPTDLTRAFRRYATALDALRAEQVGFEWETVARVLRVVSPLALAPRVAPEARYLFAATGDRLVPPAQVRELWLHWERPRIAWCAGGHLSAMWRREPRELIRQAIRERLL